MSPLECPQALAHSCSLYFFCFSFCLTLALEVVQMWNNGNTEAEETTKEHFKHHDNVIQSPRHHSGNKVKRHRRLISLPRGWISPSLPWCDSTQWFILKVSVDFGQAPAVVDDCGSGEEEGGAPGASLSGAVTAALQLRSLNDDRR